MVIKFLRELGGIIYLFSLNLSTGILCTSLPVASFGITILSTRKEDVVSHKSSTNYILHLNLLAYNLTV